MKQPIESWLKDNSWNLIVTVAGIIVAFTILNYRINAMEVKLAEYPSQDYFELRFKNLDKNIEELKEGQEIIRNKIEVHTEVHTEAQ